MILNPEIKSIYPQDLKSMIRGIRNYLKLYVINDKDLSPRISKDTTLYYSENKNSEYQYGITQKVDNKDLKVFSKSDLIFMQNDLETQYGKKNYYLIRDEIISQITSSTNNFSFTIEDIFDALDNIKETYFSNDEDKSDSFQDKLYSRFKNFLYDIFQTILGLIDDIVLLFISVCIIVNLQLRSEYPSGLFYPNNENKFPYVFFDPKNNTYQPTLVTTNITKNYNLGENVFIDIADNIGAKNSNSDNNYCSINDPYNITKKCGGKETQFQSYLEKHISYENMDFFSKKFIDSNRSKSSKELTIYGLISYIMAYTSCNVNGNMQLINELFNPIMNMTFCDKPFIFNKLLSFLFIWVFYNIFKNNVTSIKNVFKNLIFKGNLVKKNISKTLEKLKGKDGQYKSLDVGENDEKNEFIPTRTCKSLINDYIYLIDYYTEKDVNLNQKLKNSYTNAKNIEDEIDRTTLTTFIKKNGNDILDGLKDKKCFEVKFNNTNASISLGDDNKFTFTMDTLLSIISSIFSPFLVFFKLLFLMIYPLVSIHTILGFMNYSSYTPSYFIKAFCYYGIAASMLLCVTLTTLFIKMIKSEDQNINTLFDDIYDNFKKIIKGIKSNIESEQATLKDDLSALQEGFREGIIKKKKKKRKKLGAAADSTEDMARSWAVKEMEANPTVDYDYNDLGYGDETVDKSENVEEDIQDDLGPENRTEEICENLNSFKDGIGQFIKNIIMLILIPITALLASVPMMISLFTTINITKSITLDYIYYINDLFCKMSHSSNVIRIMFYVLIFYSIFDSESTTEKIILGFFIVFSKSDLIFMQNDLE